MGEATDIPRREPAEIPEPPWLRRDRPKRARVPLNREAIVDAALRVLDREGAAGLSMRRIGDELGTGASAIYWHVANKEQLIQLVLDRVIEDLPRPEPEPERWQEQVKQAARDSRALMHRHPGIAQLSFGRIPLGPNAIRHMEWHLSLLRAGELPDRVVALAGDMIFLYVGAFAHEESLGMTVPTEGASSFHEFIGEMRAYLASLPADAFPNTVELADELTTGGHDERFEFGLEIIVGGLAGYSRRT